jgi:hypothetical protein
MKIGQHYPEHTTIRDTLLGTWVTQWNISMSAIVKNDGNQEWRFFGVRFRSREIGIVLRVKS